MEIFGLSQPKEWLVFDRPEHEHGPEVLWAGRIGGSTQNWAPLALADGKLVVRDQSRLICVKIAE